MPSRSLYALTLSLALLFAFFIVWACVPVKES